MAKRTVKIFTGVCVLVAAKLAFATEVTKPFYVAASAGIFRGSFNANYLDQSDAIAQNTSETFTQNGYTGGLAIGYSHIFSDSYLLGAELSGNLNSDEGKYASGSSSTAFNDTTKIKQNIDLDFVPGVLLTDSLAGYAKLGVSSAKVTDQLTSPTSQNPSVAYATYSNNKTRLGFAAGLGLKKTINHDVSVFAEYNYHDYGKINFAEFNNLGSTYTHSARVYSSAVSLGAAYAF